MVYLHCVYTTLISGLHVSSKVPMGDQEDILFIYFDTLFGFVVVFLLTSAAL